MVRTGIYIPYADWCDSLSSCQVLTTLRLKSCFGPELLPSCLPVSLKHIDLRGSNVEDVSSIASCIHLKELLIGNAGLDARIILQDISPLTACVRLQRLALFDCNRLEDLSPITSLRELRRLAVTGSRATNMTAIGGLPHLRDLDLSRSFHLTDLSELVNLPALRHLDLSFCLLARPSLLLAQNEKTFVCPELLALKCTDLEIQTVECVCTCPRQHQGMMGINGMTSVHVVLNPCTS